MLSFTGRLEDMTLGGGLWGAEVSQLCVCVCVCVCVSEFLDQGLNL